MNFEIISKIENIEPLAIGSKIRDLDRLRKMYGKGRWRKLKGTAQIRLASGRIWHFQQQVTKLREVVTSPKNYKMSASGYLAELDRMNMEVREYLCSHLSEMQSEVALAS